MPVVTNPPTGKAHPARQRALQPYLKKLQAINTDSGSAPDQPVALKIGERKLRLSPWEKARIAEFFDDEAGDTDWSVLVAHGSALIAKAMVDVERLRRDPTSSVFYALQAELMLDSAIGAALMKEIRIAIDELVQRGRLATAKSLTEFGHKLSHAAAAARGMIARSEQGTADAVMQSISGDEGEPADPVAGAPAVAELGTAAPPPDGRPDGWATFERPAARRRIAGVAWTRGRTRLLGVVALVSAVLWLGMVKLPALSAKPLANLEAAAIRIDVPIESWVARPPSLFVTVTDSTWAGLSESERIGMVREIATAASSEGYTGLLVRDSRGKPLAHWLEARGASPIRETELPTRLKSVSEAPSPGVAS